MSAAFVRINNIIYLKVDGNTQYVKFAGASTAGNTYSVNIGSFVINKVVDDFGTRHQTSSLTGPGSGIINNARYPGTEILYSVPGSGVRYYQVSCVGTSPQNQSFNYSTTDILHLLCLGNTSLDLQGGIISFPSTGYSNIYLNQSGFFKGAVNIFVKQGGQWVQCQDVYVKQGGQWKITYRNSSQYINMLEKLDDSLDFAIQVFAYDTCTVETITSYFGTGFNGFLRYANGWDLKAINGDDRFITSLSNFWSGLSVTTNGGVSTTIDAISSFIINHYVSNFGRYPDAIGYDYWINDFITSYSYTNYNILTNAMNTAFFEPGGEFVQRSALGGLVGQYDNCGNLRV